MSKQNGSSDKSLEGWRREIDLLDTELLRLLNQRAGIACELGANKVASGLPAYDARRERQVLARICEENPGPLGQESVTNIFQCIIRETRRIGTKSMQELSSKTEIKIQLAETPTDMD
jgi:chorismate mutase